jgi:hypothetical protein
MPGAAGSYRDIRASTEPARMTIGLDQYPHAGRARTYVMPSSAIRNVTVIRASTRRRAYSQVNSGCYGWRRMGPTFWTSVPLKETGAEKNSLSRG